MRYYRARQEDDELDGDQEDEELSGYRKTHQDQGATESIRQRHQRHRWAGGNGGARNWLVGIPTGQFFFSKHTKNRSKPPKIFSQRRKPQTNAYI
jgi:hypothetical protein